MVDADDASPRVISRADAKAAGLKRYFTGNPCKQGHFAERLTRGTACCACSLEQKKRWKASNQERFQSIERASRLRRKESRLAYFRRWQTQNATMCRAKASRYRTKNRKEVNRLAAAWREKNAEKVRASWQKWALKSPEVLMAVKAARRAREAGATGRFTAADITAIRVYQEDACRYCRAPLGGRGHRDHRIPLALGGSNLPENIQLLCRGCNLSKGARDPDEYERSIGFLCEAA